LCRSRGPLCVMKSRLGTGYGRSPETWALDKRLAPSDTWRALNEFSRVRNVFEAPSTARVAWHRTDSAGAEPSSSAPLQVTGLQLRIPGRPAWCFLR
jgi:hypothetical protein